jgi:predicted site-specific integrase-resolvase
MDLASASVTARAPSRAAQYVRMSTEHQQYSPENQLEIIRQYAAAHNMEIIQEYSDHGRSGLNIAGREGLNQLMDDVEAKRTSFTSLLVYDVSRWGRFQDVDESAYYEYVLKRSGIRVHYYAEQFENDGSMSSSVLKTLKRSMAAEYSRELSVKVFSGQCRLIELGLPTDCRCSTKRRLASPHQPSSPGSASFDIRMFISKRLTIIAMHRRAQFTNGSANERYIECHSAKPGVCLERLA